MRNSLSALFAAVLLVVSACAPPASPPVGTGKTNGKESVQPAKVADGLEPLVETWDAVFIDNSKVGHMHTTTFKTFLDGRELRQIESETVLTIERFGQTASQKMAFTSLETFDGEVVSFECRMSSGPGEMVASGTVQGAKLKLKSNTLGKSQETTVDWDKSWGGFFVAEMSLRQKPLAAGESRELRALMPDFPYPSTPTMKLEAIAIEPTELLDSSRELLKIKQTIELGGDKKIESFVWTDTKGEVLKSQVAAGVTQTSYRTTRDVALAKSVAAKFDLGFTTTVRVAKPLENAHQTKRVVYRAKLKEGDLKEAFAIGPTQSVKLLDGKTAEIVVRAIRPDAPAKLESPDVPPTDDDKLPNGMIQSDDRKVVALADAAAPGETDHWRLAIALEKHVKQSMKSVNFSQAFATAAETAASLEGDCTEHAMLLAAVCRARKIPARVAVGLVYDGRSGFAFHMWTEVWIRDRWIPLDATRGAGGIGGAHLKIADTNLKVASITTALLPVFNVLGRLELEIVEAE